MEDQTIGIQMIAQERKKQIDKHGFTGKHHAEHPEWYELGQLTSAAATLSEDVISPNTLPPFGWDKIWFENLTQRPYKERLMIAGALIAAEIDRLTELGN